jgi:hypothetical protein
MEWLIKFFESTPNGFWSFLSAAAVPFFLWLFNKLKSKKENNLAKKIDLIDTKLNILNELHKHRPFYIDLKIKLEDRIFYTAKGKNEYLSELFSRGLEKLMPIFSDILESDFKIVNKDKTMNRIILAAKTIKDSLKIEKLELKKGTEVLFITEVAEELKSIIASYSFDLEQITATKENGKRREAFEALTTSLVCKIISSSALVHNKYKVNLKDD